MPTSLANDAVVYQRVLPMNRCLNVGDRIASGNGMFFATLEADGQLRVYRGGCPERQQGVLWATGRGGDGGRFFALVQTDGNFCIYRGDGLSRNQGWHWGTQMTADGGQFHAVLNNDGSLVVCKGSDPAIAAAAGVEFGRHRSGRQHRRDRTHRLRPGRRPAGDVAAVRPVSRNRQQPQRPGPDQHDQRIGQRVRHHRLVR